MQSHSFTDDKSLLQMVSSPTETEFMNMETSSIYEESDTQNYITLMVILGNRKFIHQRQVYDFMAFLGDAGGV